MAKKKICGVYKITNIVNNNIYVGSSKDVEHRWQQHRDSLDKGRHGNIHLQNAWNKYKSHSFVFEIIEECTPEIQFEREQHYLNTLNPFGKNGYNIVRQISKKYMSDNYMIKKCERCGCEYHTFSNLSKYCEECKDEIKKENWENFENEKYWMRDTGMCIAAMCDGYNNIDDFWESNF